MIAKREKVVGIDFGSQSVKIAVISRKSDEILEAEDFYNVKCDIGENFVGYLEEGKLKEDLKNIWDVLKLKGSKVSIILPFYNTIVIAIRRKGYIPKEKLEDLIREELARNSPIPVEELVFDYFIYYHDEEELRGIYVVARKSLIEKLIDIIEELGSKIALIDSTCTALTNLVIFEEETKDFLVIDIGYGSTKLIVVRDYEITLNRYTTSISGKSVTERIIELTAKPIEEAELLKTSFALESHIYETLSEEVGATIFSELISLGTDYLSVSKIYLTGGGSLLLGLKDKIRELTNIDTEIFVPQKKITYSKSIQNMLLEITVPKFIASIGSTIGVLNSQW